MRKYTINEFNIRNSLKKNLLKEIESPKKDIKKDGEIEEKPRCVAGNMIPLDEIVGSADEYEDYATGVNKRKLGVNSMVDTLGILNNIRLFKDIKDGGSHLAYKLMHHLNKFRNKNYFDEASNECKKAMNKITELYKENEHGTELVKDIERVLNLQTKDDEYTPSPRAKEYLKRCVELAKGK
jgi:hypothetical protein